MVPYLRKRNRSPWFFSAPAAWSQKDPTWLPHLVLNPRANLPLLPHFQLLPQLAPAASIPVFFYSLLGCHSKSGQVWPCGVEPIISKLLRRPGAELSNQGGLPPSYIMG